MIFTKNFRRIKDGQVGYAPRREKRTLAWGLVRKIAAGAGVALSVSDVGEGKGKVKINVALPSGKDFERHVFFEIQKSLFEDAARHACSKLTCFEPGRAFDADISPTKAPVPEVLADVEAAYASLDAAGGALLRAQIA